MKTCLLILAIMACACVAYARPDGQAHPNENKKVLIDLDKLTNELRAEFADEKFLIEKLGQPTGCDRNTSPAGGSTVNVLKGGWVSKIPWGVIIDVVVEAIRKATEKN